MNAKIPEFDLVREHDLGYIVGYGDVPGLGDEIVRILRDPAEALRRAREGREYGLANFGRDSLADKWVEVYPACAEK